jgi:hypothetical protein
MMAEHTKGPWELEESLRGNNYTAISGDDWIELATVVTRMKLGGDDSPEGLANARLIAAAPELLEALENIILSSDANCGDSLANAIEAARAAIAKAKEAA